MASAKYISFLPGGNKTALVIGTEYDSTQRRAINKAIMNRDPDMEQVGFVRRAGEYSLTGQSSTPSLQMAGDEFCGNATRSAAYYYLNGKPGRLVMTVSGGRKLACGVYENGHAWCEIPLAAPGIPQIETVTDDIHKVSLSGITHLVIEPETAIPFLKDAAGSEDPDRLRKTGLSLIEKYGLKELEAAGAIFLELNSEGKLKIHPIVWVRDIASLFYETACGSGTVAAAMVQAEKTGGEIKTAVLQPSGMTIRAELTLKEDTSVDSSSPFTRAVISGPVQTDMIQETCMI